MISKFGQTNTDSIISVEDSSKHENNLNEQNFGSMRKKIKCKNNLHYSRYTKTEVTLTDTKSYRKGNSRELSISSNRSGYFSKKTSLPRRNYSPSRGSK